MDADALELCKENIQPLKQGRKASALGLVLLAEEDSTVQEKLLKEREEFELAIINYDGDDPLEPRYEYARWIEQHCPSQGKSNNLTPLLEDTIMLLKENDSYKQDPRFIELIIKYIDSQDNAAELYQTVYSQGLGTMCAIFYKSWADSMDMMGDAKRADQVYRLGISARAEPVDVLRTAHNQFQLSVGRRMMQEGFVVAPKPISTETTERQRQVLGKLKKNPGSVRSTSGLPGSLTDVARRSAPQKMSAPLVVYQEPNNGIEGLIVRSSESKLTTVDSKGSRKENTRLPEPWNHAETRHSRRQPIESPFPCTPNFKILADPVDECEKQTPSFQPKSSSSKVLKTRKSELAQASPMHLFTSPHPSLKHNVPLFESFTGGREFSFEELRLDYYNRKQREEGCSTKKASLRRKLEHKFNNDPCSSSSLCPVVEEKDEECVNNVLSSPVTAKPSERQDSKANDRHSPQRELISFAVFED